MGGSRKHGFLRSSSSGRRRAFWEIDWTCTGCGKRKSYFTDRTDTLDGRSLCNRCYGVYCDEKDKTRLAVIGSPS